MQKNRKTATRRPSAPKSGARASTPTPPAEAQQAARQTPVSREERYRMIAEAAYYRAQRRGFQGGNTAQDWLDAEAEIDARLLNRR
jgi:hypothetical protein